MSWKEESKRYELESQIRCGKIGGHSWVNHNPDQDQVSKYKRCKFCGKIETK